MKDNLYYYFFYKISKFIKKIGTKNNDYIESGCAFYSVCMMLNVLAALLIIAHYYKFSIPSTYLPISIVAFPLWFINRIFLIKNENRVKIFSFFDNYPNTNKLKKRNLILVLYICLSVAFPILLAYFHRQGKW